MKNISNIEKSAFHKGEYVGYAPDGVWRIRKSNSTYGNWIARHQDDNKPWNPVYAFTLEQMGAALVKREASTKA